MTLLTPKLTALESLDQYCRSWGIPELTQLVKAAVNELREQDLSKLDEARSTLSKERAEVESLRASLKKFLGI